MIPVSQALAALFDLTRMMPVEWVPLTKAAGRVLRQRVHTDLRQPPFDSSAMDGYAIGDQDMPAGTSLRVIGESAAGHPFAGSVQPGTAVRIFTGGVVPPGATRVVIQEDVTRDGDTIRIQDDADPGPYIRPAGSDFAPGFTLSAPRRLTPNDVAL
ncbi:MAG: molybdopterin molybdenumtransferase MoeA, partial [Primorskyibacter sp.]